MEPQRREPFGDLLSVINDEELIRLRVRLSKKESLKYLADILLDKMIDRKILRQHYSDKII